MRTINPISSLMDFNRRVLDRGTPRNISQITDVSTLSDLLFFNTVFSSNTEEMFQKYNMTPAIDEYIDLCTQRTQNIRAILKQFCMICKDVVISDYDCTESRLAVEKHISQLEMEGMNLPAHFNSELIHDAIYMAERIGENYINLIYVDPHSTIMTEPLTYTANGRTIYWKTDAVIRNRLRIAGTKEIVTFRVTRNQEKGDMNITKVEFDGDAGVMEALASSFPANCLIIRNPFLYTRDVEAMVHSKLPPKVASKVGHHHITFQEIFNHDILMEYPLNSFDEYLHLLRMASDGRLVSDIYLTLYRIGKDPTLFYILQNAVKNNVNVHVNIELAASGEDINAFWYHEMRNAGINVTIFAYGEMKVHCKLTLIRFRSGQMVAQVGTGNYHSVTTHQYTDLSLITANQVICKNILKVFHVLEDKRDQKFGNDVLVTKYNVRDRLISLIDHEMRKGADGYIAFKCNALSDPEIIEHLDDAAVAGCRMDLMVRGTCIWLPDQIGTTVTIRSIVWDKLEHSRVYAFGAKNPKIYIGSLDLVRHKLDNRIETLVRLRDPDTVVTAINYLNRYITNTSETWVMTDSGTYRKERNV